MENYTAPARESQPQTSTTCPPPPAVRPPFDCDRADFLLILSALLVGFFFIRLIWTRGYGAAVPTFIALVYAVTCLYTKLSGIDSHTREAFPWHALTAALTLPFLLFDGRDGRLLLTLGMLFVSTAFAIYTQLGCRRFHLHDNRFAADLWNASVCAPLGNLGSIWYSTGELARRGRSRNVLLVLAGLLLGLPMLLVLTVLLASADAAFEGLLDMVELRLFEALPEYFWSFVLGIPFAMVAFGILYGCRYKRRVQAVTTLPLEKTRRVPAALALGMLVPTTLLCLIYLGSQLAYFFSAFSGLLPANFTYAEYARRGFFELCAISVLLLTLVAAINLFMQAQSPALQRTRQLISAFFCLFALILTATSLSKMVLYIRVYGVTPLRMTTSLFMIALGLCLIWIVLRLFLSKFRLVRALTVTVLCALLALSYIDMDVLSLRVNCALSQADLLQDNPEAETIGGFSFRTLVTMSDGIVPFLEEQAVSGDPEAAKLAKRVLTARPDYRPSHADPWTWNLARARADRE